MARIENYVNDVVVTIDDKVIGTDAVDNSTKNFTVGDIVALANAGSTLTAGTGISITNGVISSTIVDTDTNNYISNVALNGTSLDFTGTAPAFSGSIPLGAIADQTVTIAGTNGIAVTGTYPNFSISGASVAGNYDWSLFADTGDLDPVTSGSQITFAGGTNVTTTFANGTLTIDASGASTLASLTDTTIAGPVNNEVLVYNGAAWVNGNVPTSAPESLILRISNTNPIPITTAPGTDLTFAQQGALVKTNSVHLNAADIALANATDITVTNGCTAKVSLGAYLDNGGQAGQITFQAYEVSGGMTLVGEASFDLSNQATTVIPTTFFSFFDFQPGEIYKFTAYSTQHAMVIVPNSFIQIEILK